VALATIATKLGLYFYTRIYGRKFNSLLILANSEDHRNDVFVTSGTLLGILAAQIGIWWLDGVVGLLISLWIGYTGVRILLAAMGVLMDTAIDSAMKEHLIADILEIPNVNHIDSISSMPVGARYILIIKVSVPPDLTVVDGHTIAGQIRALLRDHREVADAVVHINPDFPQEEDQNPPSETSVE
jgi:cation diffusion facilitator family transporter